MLKSPMAWVAFLAFIMYFGAHFQKEWLDNDNAKEDPAPTVRFIRRHVGRILSRYPVQLSVPL